MLRATRIQELDQAAIRRENGERGEIEDERGTKRERKKEKNADGTKRERERIAREQ